jgi:error-prone DNA polymerase
VPLFQEQLLRVAMVAAGFTGAEAEELRRAFGFKRSEARMAEIEKKLRAGMTRQGIEGAAAEEIVRAITSFALYGFPEAHAASFALLAYASAYLKLHHPAAFYASLLNPQPMGFYPAATIVKDAQRHGQRMLPVDVGRSAWLCTVEATTVASEGLSEFEERHGFAGALRAPGGLGGPSRPPKYSIRLGFRYVKGLRETAGRAIVAARAAGPFRSIVDLTARAGLAGDEVQALAGIGALAALGATRRAALWTAARPAPSPLFAGSEGGEMESSPLPEMNELERLVTDYAGTGVTIGRHPMALRRDALARAGVTRARDLPCVPVGARVRVAGSVIVRQRPGTAKGFVFLSLEDETGVANVIVTPQLFARRRLTLVSEPFLLVEGIAQAQDGVISIRAARVCALARLPHAVPSHDFG